MHFFYNISVGLYAFAVKLASIKNSKAKKFVAGRRHWQKHLAEKTENSSRIIWFHAASLGEMEQGLPIIREARQSFKEHSFLITFFSPSGYEHFKEESLIDAVAYLPIDTPSNATAFLDIVKPELAFFIKYEIWPNYFLKLKKRNIPLIVAPAIFRPDHIYFRKPANAFFKKVLQSVSRFLVQNEASAVLLQKNDIEQVEVCGDTRFDRVLEIVNAPFEDEYITNFTAGSFTIVAGSTWPPDDKLLGEVIRGLPGVKWILAPHHVEENNIEKTIGLIGNEYCIRYSQKPVPGNNSRVLIIDNIGMLSRLYRFGQLAYIGGGFSGNVHSTVEPVGYGLPVIFGPEHSSFIEPGEMLQQGIGFEVREAEELLTKIQTFLDQPDHLQSVSAKAKGYANSKTGSVKTIINTIKRLLES